MLEKIKNFLLYAGFDRNRYLEAKEFFPEANRRILIVLSAILGVVALLLSFMASNWENRGIMVGSLFYFGFSLVNFCLCFFVFKFGKSFPKVILFFCYVVLIACYTLGIHTGVGHGPSRLAVSIAAMVTACPIVFYESAFRMCTLNALACAVFIALSYHMKDTETFLSDLVDVAPFAVVGCILCYITTRIKVNNLVQRRELADKTQQIDELNTNLLAQNRELESSLEHERLNTSMIRGLSNSFYAVYFFDLVNDTFKEVKSVPDVRKIAGTEGVASSALECFCDTVIISENRTQLKKLADMKEVGRLLREKGSIVEEFLDVNSQWNRARFIPLSYEADGEISEALVCLRNINDEKESILRQESIQKLNESINSGLWRMEFDEKADVSGCFYSETYRKMLGYEPSDEFPYTLEAWAERLHPEDRELVMTAFWTAVYDRSGCIVYDVKYRAKMKSGEYHWYHAAGRVSRRIDGSPFSMIGVFIDINKQKEMEVQLERQQATLRDAFVAAQQASAAKSAFLNNMSHDIRTPLNAILGFSTLAESHLDDVNLTKDYITKISSAGKHLLELINDVLDMSRIESGKVKIDEAPARISVMMDEIKTMVNDSAKARNLDLRFDLSGVIDDCVSCDKLRLKQVLLNLVGNAIKFGREGGFVAVSVTQKGEANDLVAVYEIVVEDDGIGMGKDFMAHIFEPFEREKVSTVSGIQGTGLGLAICKNLVTMMGGTIDVESEAGKGSKFTITLGLTVLDSADHKQEPVAIEELTLDRFKGLKVLLVEDNALNAEIAQSILQEAGFVVDTVDDGSVAVERIRTAELGQYDVILMDVQMPVMDGYEATRQIRALHRSGISSLPIIAVTANAFEEDRLQALQAGMDGHVSKPIEIPKLMAALKSVLR